MTPVNVLMDYDFEEEEEFEEVVDFEDLVDEEIDPKQTGSYLKISSRHMKEISTVHIKMQLIAQILAIIVIILSYTVMDLLVVKNPSPETNPWAQEEAWIDALQVLTPAGNQYWYW